MVPRVRQAGLRYGELIRTAKPQKMNYRLGRDNTPDGPTVQDTVKVEYQHSLEAVREILYRTASDPETLAQAIARLNLAYDAVCENDPVFSADQNTTEGSEMEEIMDAVKEKMKTFAAKNTQEYLTKRQVSRHRQWYPPLDDAPSAETSGDEAPPQPGAGWLQWLRRWQPFADRPSDPRPTGLASRRRSRRFSSFPESRSPARIHVYRPPGANIHRAFVRPSRFRRPLDQGAPPEVLIDSPMEVDLNRTRREQAEAIQRTGSYLPKTTEGAADVTMASVADQSVSGRPGTPAGRAGGLGASGRDPDSRKRQRVLEMGRKLKRKLTPTLKRKHKESPSQAVAADAKESSSPESPLGCHTGPSAARSASENAARAPCRDALQAAPTGAARMPKGNGAAHASTAAPEEGAEWAARAEKSDAESKGSDAPQSGRGNPAAATLTVAPKSKQSEVPTSNSDVLEIPKEDKAAGSQPYWKVDIEHQDHGVRTSLQDGLACAFEEAARRLDLSVLVKKLTLNLFVCDPQPPPQSTGDDPYDPVQMEAVQAQLAALQARLTDQETELARHRTEAEDHRRTLAALRTREQEQNAALADHRRREEEQAADRAALLAQLRQATGPAVPPTTGCPPSETTTVPRSDPPTSVPQPSGQGPPSCRTDRSGSDASTSAPNGDPVEERIRRMEAQFSEQNRELRAELDRLRAGKEREDAREALARRAEDALAASQRHRELIAGQSKAAVAARYKTDRSWPPTGAEEAEKDMMSCLAREDEHRAGLPRTGEGFHYLAGATPFWRQPWPAKWKLVKPWEFAIHYDHKDMLQQIKNLQLAVFEGDPETYPQWQCMFYKTVHVQDMDVDVKYNYLMRHLSPKVKAFAIRGVSLSKSNYCHAITRLEKKYGPGERQIELSMTRLTSIKPFLPQETAKAEEFLQRLQGYLDESGGSLSRETAQTLMPTLRHIVPQIWMREYLRWVETERTESNPATLLAFLTDLMDLEEELRDCKGPAKTIATVAPRRRNSMLPAATARPVVKEAVRPAPALALVAGEGADCPCCEGGHRLKQCPRFLQEYDNFERRELLERLGYCLVCFTGTHRGRGCLNRRLCELCRQEHSTWAHVPEDDEMEAAAYYAGEDEGGDAEAHDEMNYEELTGDSLGEGFLEEDGEEVIDDDDLRYGFMSVDSLGPGREESLRRSSRLEARRRTQSMGGQVGWPRTGPSPGLSGGQVTPRTRVSRTPSPRAARPSALKNPGPGVALLPSPGRPIPARRSRPTPAGRTKAVTFKEPSPVPRTVTRSAEPSRPGALVPLRAQAPAAAPLPAARPIGTDGSRIVTSRDVVRRPPGQRIGVGLQQVLANVQNPTTKEHMTVKALVDTGSNHTAISKRLADKLGVDGVTAPYKVITFGGEVFQQPSRLVRVTIRSPNGQIERTLMVRSVSNLCGDLRVWAWNDLKRGWPHMKNLDFPEPVGDLRVDLLIGTDNADLVRVVEPDRLGQDPQDPVVRRTTFGLVALGLVRPWHDSLADRVNLVQAFACPGYEASAKQRLLEMESSLYWDLRRLFSVEHRIEEDFLRHVKDSKTLGREQAEAAAQVHASRQYLPGQRQYCVGIPWRDQRRPDNNLWEAVRLFKSYVRRAGPDSEPIEKMTATIDGWIKEGYARVLSPAEARSPDSFVIPSFVVTRIDKTTTQHRLVINAAKEFGGRCLNDFIARTPDVMNNLYDVLLRFRRGTYAYTADIQHMFLRVLTEPEDRRYVRILYQPVKGGGVFVVECSRHMFGLRSSPYVAMEVIKLHAEARRHRFPLAAVAVAEASIVDDVLVAVDEVEELHGVHQELTSMFGEMSMAIHKCASNHAPFMRALPVEQRAKQVRLEDIEASNPEVLPVIKALGLVYRPEDDEFRFEYGHDAPRKWTLRGMVAAVARLYDPLGLVAPFLMAGRAIVQIIWMNGTSWDDVVDKDTAEKCSRWVARAAELTEVRIPRQICDGPWGSASGGNLAVFSDACRIGYAAAAYYVTEGQSRLVAARTRVAPTKKDESVQRLELAGCQLATDVAVEVCQALGLDIDRAAFYTDSMTLLAWLRTTSRMSVYVSNRVCKVRDRTEVIQWHYVPGADNPADIASRGARPRALVKNRLWFEGPAFLLTGEKPEQPQLIEDQAVKDELISYENQLRKVTLFCALVPPQPITEFIIQYVQNRSLLQRSVRILSLVIRAVSILRRAPVELGQAFRELWSGVLDALVLDHQAEHWPTEITALRRGETPRSLRSLRPYLDAKGIMRMRSRLGSCWWLDYESKNPVVIHGNGGLALQLLTHLHAETLGHSGGPSQLLGRSRVHFWITSGRRVARRAVDACVRCRRERQAVTRPEMADLHPTRLGGGRDLRAFKEVGVDMAGPFVTRTPVGTRRRPSDQKRYMLIISCCATRAVCLEMMMTADTESCLMALERFVAVYGRPEKINSDAGGNLLATREEMYRSWQWWEKIRTADFARHPEIQWSNNPPYSPNWGGHYERLIGIAKKALGKIMANRAGTLHDEELGTLFKRVQSLLNDRPITAVVQEDDSLLGLTPNCFLKTGGRHPLVAPGSEDLSPLRRHRMLENVLQQYWKQFANDYATSLHKTEKWTKTETPLAKGDVVTIVHQGLPFGRWPLGRIIETYPGKDGIVRSALVETWAGGRRAEFRRSVSGMKPIVRVAE